MPGTPTLPGVLIWINGTFGAGKTTTARSLVEQRPALRLFDPEWVGYMLTSNLQGIAIDDFQDLAAWRQLVPVVARHLTEISGQHLVAVQTVLSEAYWHELRGGLAAEGLEVFHVVLDADPDTLRARILADAEERSAQEWRLDHLPLYAASRAWLLDAADLVVDTASLGPDAVARAIADAY